MSEINHFSRAIRIPSPCVIKSDQAGSRHKGLQVMFDHDEVEGNAVARPGVFFRILLKESPTCWCPPITDPVNGVTFLNIILT